MINWNTEYRPNIKTFIKLRDEGEETPLDILPELDQLEKWIYDSFYNIKRLTDSMNGGIDLKTFDLYFKYYPISISKLDFISIISNINTITENFRQEIKSKTKDKRDN